MTPPTISCLHCGQEMHVPEQLWARLNGKAGTVRCKTCHSTIHLEARAQEHEPAAERTAAFALDPFSRESEGAALTAAEGAQPEPSTFDGSAESKSLQGVESWGDAEANVEAMEAEPPTERVPTLLLHGEGHTPLEEDEAHSEEDEAREAEEENEAPLSLDSSALDSTDWGAPISSPGVALDPWDGAEPPSGVPPLEELTSATQREVWQARTSAPPSLGLVADDSTSATEPEPSKYASSPYAAAEREGRVAELYEVVRSPGVGAPVNSMHPPRRSLPPERRSPVPPPRDPFGLSEPAGAVEVESRPSGLEVGPASASSRPVTGFWRNLTLVAGVMGLGVVVGWGLGRLRLPRDEARVSTTESSLAPPRVSAAAPAREEEGVRSASSLPAASSPSGTLPAESSSPEKRPSQDRVAATAAAVRPSDFERSSATAQASEVGERQEASSTRGSSAVPPARPSSVASVEAASTAPSEAPGPFDPSAASLALEQAATEASSCRKGTDPSGIAKVMITFAPSGRATAATISGPPFAGTETGSCVAAQLRGARVPPFEGDYMTVKKTVTIH